MKRMFLTTAALMSFALAGAGWASAQAPAKAHDAHEAHHDTASTKAAPGGMPAMGGGMGNATGMGMCPMMGGGGGMTAMGGMGSMMGMGGADTQMAVKNTDKGVTITLTASDPTKVVRLQKMAEAMRLMHEATAP